MSLDNRLTTAEIQAIFAEEVRAAGGSVSDTFDDGARLFTRSVLPGVRDVRPGDRLQGGVALRATGPDVWVHPYVFRQVCRNGAIMAHALQSEHIEGLEYLPPEEAASAVREAVQACCAEEAFTAAAEEMRSAVGTPIDTALNLLPMLSHLPSGARAQVLGDILDRFSREADRSTFGLMNAVTAVARDSRDPELRWRLEELGGGIPAGRTPTPLPDDRAAAHVLVG
jgi:hypothetical protein